MVVLLLAGAKLAGKALVKEALKQATKSRIGRAVTSDVAKRSVIPGAVEYSAWETPRELLRDPEGEITAGDVVIDLGIGATGGYFLDRAGAAIGRTYRGVTNTKSARERIAGVKKEQAAVRSAEKRLDGGYEAPNPTGEGILTNAGLSPKSCC